MKRIIILVCLFLSGCTYNVSLVNGNKNETGVNAPVDKNIPVSTDIKVPASMVGGL